MRDGTLMSASSSGAAAREVCASDSERLDFATARAHPSHADDAPPHEVDDAAKRGSFEATHDASWLRGSFMAAGYGLDEHTNPSSSSASSASQTAVLGGRSIPPSPAAPDHAALEAAAKQSNEAPVTEVNTLIDAARAAANRAARSTLQKTQQPCIQLDAALEEFMSSARTIYDSQLTNNDKTTLPDSPPGLQFLPG